MGWFSDKVRDIKWAVEDVAWDVKNVAGDVAWEVKNKAQDVYYKGKEVQDGWQNFKEDVSPTKQVNELNAINEKMQTLVDETEKRVDAAKKNFNKECKSANKQRKDVFENTLTEFEGVFSKLKEVEFDKEFVKLEKVEQFESARLTYQSNSIQHEFVWKTALDYTSPAIVLNPIALGRFFIASAVKSTLLDMKIEEAKAEHAKLKKECEKAKTTCVKIESLTEAFNRYNGTVKILKKLTDNLIKEVDTIEQKSGYNYKAYTKEEKSTVMMMYNFTMALNDLIMIEVMDKKGNVHPDFEKFVGEAELMIGSGTNG